MAIHTLAPVLAMGASLGGVALLGATSGNGKLRDFAAIAIAALQSLIVLSMIPAVMAGESIRLTLFELGPLVPVAFEVDALGLTFALTGSLLWLLTAVYAVGYLDQLHSAHRTRFHICFALTMTATMGVAFAANLVTLYLFYEAMTLATYYLVVHDGTDEAFHGGRRYLAYHLGTSIAFLLPAIALTWVYSGSFDFVAGGVFGGEVLSAHRGMLTVIFVLFLLGSTKAALMPLHGWLPSAMVAPVPVSALLHAVAVVNAGAFGVLRVVFDVFGPEPMQSLGLDTMTVYVACFTIVAASLYALRLDSLKALLAYSTIGQLAFIVLGGALLSKSGMTGGVIHIVNHGVSKITLFLCAGAIYVAAREKNLSGMHGIGRQMPLTLAAFSVAAFSMIGFPATAGFISKWYLLMGAFEAERVIAVAALLASTLLSAIYYLRAIGILAGVRLGATHAGLRHTRPASVREVNLWMLLPLLITAGLVLVLGLFPEATVLPLARALGVFGE